MLIVVFFENSIERYLETITLMVLKLVFFIIVGGLFLVCTNICSVKWCDKVPLRIILIF